MFEFLGVIFAAGLVGWLFLIAVSIAIICSIEFESNLAGLATIAVATVLVFFFGGVGIPTVAGVFGWFDKNLLKIVWLLLLYVIGGGIWGSIKYLFWVHDQRDWFKTQEKELRKQYDKGYHMNGYTPINKTTSPMFADYHRASWEDLVGWMNNKARIATWMAWWPWSAFWTLVRDPFKHAFRFIYETMAGLMKQFSDWVYTRNFADIK
jgi:hypothetical protein